MIEIIPAIMPRDFDELTDAAAATVHHVPTVQIDIMDGKFVQDKTWPYDHHEEENFLAICREEEGMPYWDNLNYELDLMIQHPDANFEQWVALGPKRIILHIESLQNPEQAFEEIQQYRQFIEIGLSFDDNYDIAKIEPFLGQVDFVQCMGIDVIGAQGEPFSEKVIENLEYLRKKYPKLPLSVDGSVNMETVQSLVEAGATRLVAGSAVFGGGDVVENIEGLQSLVQ
jgi:ribulose-phosphate 3-epimerase